MTVSSTTTKVSASGDGATAAFAYTFKIFADGDLQVIIRSSAGVETVKTLTTHYTVSGAGDDDGGTVTFTTGNIPASGETVLIKRALGITQGTDYVENDPFPAESHESGLDRLTMVSQQQQEEVDRSIKGTTSDATGISMALPSTDLRASKFLLFDASGNVGVASTDTLTVSTLQAFTDYRVTTATGDGSTVAFTLTAEPGQEGNTQVFLDGVYQSKSNYTLAGTTLTFSTAPASSVAIEVVHGQAASTYSPDDASIAFAKLADTIDEDDMASDSATKIPTQQSVKAYADAQITAQDLDLTSDSGTIDIDLDSDTLTIAGGSGIDTSASSTTVTIAGEDATAANKGVASFSSDNFAVSSGAVTIKAAGVAFAEIADTVDEDNMASDSAVKVPTQQSVKAYVDAQVTAQDLDFQGDSGGALNIDLDSEVLDIAGGTGIDTSGSSNTLTVAIDSTVATLTGSQTLTNKSLTAPTVTGVVGGTQTSATITALTATSINGVTAATAQYTSAEETKLSGVETAADVTDATNVAAAGAHMSGGTDIPVADGGTGASTLTDGGVLLGSGTGAITAMAVLADGELIVGDGTTDPVAESGATLRTSIGVGTGDSPTFAGLTTSGIVSVDDTTDSTGTTSGSIHTDGGLGVAKDVIAGATVMVGGNITTSRGNANGSIEVSHNSGTMETGTASGNADELIIVGAATGANSGMTILSGVAQTGNVFFGDNGDTDIGGITYNHNGNAMTFVTNATTQLTLSSAGLATFVGALSVDDTTDSTSGTSGSIQTDGGIGAAKDIVTGGTFKALGSVDVGDSACVGGSASSGLLLIGQGSVRDVTIMNDTGTSVIGIPTGTLGVTFAGDISIDGTTDSTSTTSGSIHTDGGLGVAKDVFVGGALHINGSDNALFAMKTTGDTASQVMGTQYLNNSDEVTAQTFATGDNSSAGVFRIKAIGAIDLIGGDIGVTAAAADLRVAADGHVSGTDMIMQFPPTYPASGTSTTYQNGALTSADSSLVNSRVPCPLTVKKMYVYVNSTLTTGSAVVTLMKDGAAQANTVGVDTSGGAFDSSPAISFTVGQRIGIKVETSATSAAWYHVTLLCERDAD